MIALALALSIQHEPMPSYADARRCAGLTIAHHRAVADDATQGTAAFDASLYWSLVVGDRARKDRIAHDRFERDVAAEVERAGKQLAAAEPSATAELARCVARVPR